ncbi:MBL fold metallo-hydrolase [Persicimonas caeni]|uniref:MBL fold metallo-hydrolase n=1 Tax=Persicimonas caeni TaxID=2292766 RepID=A0A4Y6PZV2_PERCE|nr:MBL fold metallo-hydrolase [Persicimonas caeni]QDG53793.1 MBL fold metallo-hydrolase [Persicimonas caeni]QED35014.1 MBL fold metallo-hydrolase [Persicimonas caeni]
MFFKRIYDEGLAQASYLIACASTGEAVVVDPTRDIDIYLDEAREQGFEIVGALETHIHADFLSGARELAKSVGGKLYVSGETVSGWKYKGLDDFDTVHLKDGDGFALGNVRFEAVHTPGHTPEHLSYLVTDGAQADEPMMVLTGDFVFVGDLGRPDLLETAAGQSGTAKKGGKQLFGALRDKFVGLSHEVLVWPGHGAGSACGKALGSIPASSVGYETKHNWWKKYIDDNDQSGFVEELLADQPETPSYFRKMKELNRDGMTFLGGLPTPAKLLPDKFRALRREDAHLLDLRDKEAFAAKHVPGALNFSKLEELSTHAGWVLPYDDRPLVLIGRADQMEEATRRLVRIGMDNIVGYVTHIEGAVDDSELGCYPIVDVEHAHKMWESDDATVLDVRAQSEWEEGHIPGAIHVHYGKIRDNLDEIPRDQKLVVHCASGIRANLAISQLRAEGYEHVANMPAGFDGWKKAGYRTEES